MAIDTRSVDNGSTLVIRIAGEFDFNLVNEFRRAYEDHPGYDRYVVDLGVTESIDSSALGMLLNMDRFLPEHARPIEIVNGNRVVNRVLEIARFEQKFRIGKADFGRGA